MYKKFKINFQNWLAYKAQQANRTSRLSQNRTSYHIFGYLEHFTIYTYKYCTWFLKCFRPADLYKLRILGINPDTDRPTSI